MRELDKSADLPLMAANANRKPIRVLWLEGANWNVEHAFSTLEAEALASQYRQMGYKVETFDPELGE